MDEDRIQLGTILLELTSGPSIPTPWTPLTLPILTQLQPEINETSQKIFTSLRYLLNDQGLEFQATYQHDQDGVLIRATILPSDARKSAWKRTQNRAIIVKERSKHLRELFWHLRTGWDGQGDYLMGRTEHDLKKIQDLYMSIPSPPEPDFEVEKGMTFADRNFKSRLMYHEEPFGVKTLLYRYQFRTVARMLQMETKPGRLLDTSFSSFQESGRSGMYYVDTSTGDIQRRPGWYDLPRGGILAEQMGTGKTLAVLTLIVGTLPIPVAPPPDALDISPAMSSYTLSKFPFPPYARARQETKYPQDARLGIPSLVSLCAGVLARTDRSGSSMLTSDVESMLRQKMMYYEYPLPDQGVRKARQHLERREVQKIRLANTTLIVVPQILIEQWKQEIEKHLEPGTLKVLEIGKEEVPPVEKLMEYDVILIDVLRFGQEEKTHRMGLNLDESEFSKARWKRIVLDEGHVAGTKSDAMRLAISLGIERRWIVSGTPTKHLQQGGEHQVRRVPGKDAKTDSVAWSKRDLEDAQRIGVMIGGFLAAQPFQSESNFNQKITNLLRGKEGPKFGSVRRLKYLMDALIVKHAPNVIDMEASLPPSTVTTEVLQFHPMQRITYNVLAALIATNVYTSNFSDPDYFLHPRNAAAFKQVIQNLHLACFWYSAPAMGAAECLQRNRKQLEVNDTLTPSGRAVLEEAVRHLETALATPGWEEWMANGVSIPYEAASLPSLIRDGWSDSMDERPDLVDAKSLYHLRDLNEPGKSAHEISMAGWMDRGVKHQDFLEIMKKEQQRTMREGKKRLMQLDELDMERDSATAASHSPIFTKTLKGKKMTTPKKGKMAQLDQQLDVAARNAEAAARVIRFDTPDRTDPLPMPAVLETKSRSSKLNFVVRSILDSEPSDKYVIFGDVFELGHVTEALDLVDVKSCFAGATISAAKRIEALKELEKPETKAILLDLRLGARGLNLVCANRMIFLAPTWNLDVQAQAIKRVHRIGQTKPTKIEILVTRGTFEEDISERASNHRTDAEEQLYSRAMIENPSFVYPEDEGDWTFPIRFVPLSSDQKSPSASTPDTMPITPTTMRHVRVASPCIGYQEDEGDVKFTPEQSVSKKRPNGDDVEVKPFEKKKARVTFA